MSGAKKKSERRATQAQMGLSEREKQELLKQKAQRRNNIIAIVGGVVAVVLVVALLVWNSGFFSRHTTAVKFAATEGDIAASTLTKADMAYYYYSAMNDYYSQEQNMASMYEQMGMEYTRMFDPSASPKEQYVDAAQSMTFHDYFKQQAMTNATDIVSMYNAAKAAGHTLSEDAQTSLDSALSDLDAQIAQYGLGSRNNYLRNIYSQAVTEKVYLKNVEQRIWAYDYYSSVTETMGDYSDEALEAYYAEHSNELDNYDYDYVYFDGTAQPTTDAEGNSVEPSEEDNADALAQAKLNADDMLAALKAEPTVDDEGNTQTKDFTTLAADLGAQANVQTGNAGSNISGMPFADWLMDTARTHGDVELFEEDGGSGYYVVQFHGRARNDNPTVDVRHILAAFEAEEGVDHEQDENGSIIYTDAEKQAAHDKAAAWLDEFNAGDKTAEAFGALAEQYSDDRGQDGSLNSEGGLYEGVKMGDMVQPFEDWSFDASRQEGDTGLVETTYGWHVMYYQGFNRPEWKDDAADAMLSDDQQAFLNEVKAKYPVSVNKWSDTTSQASAEPSAEGQEG